MPTTHICFSIAVEINRYELTSVHVVVPCSLSQSLDLEACSIEVVNVTDIKRLRALKGQLLDALLGRGTCSHEKKVGSKRTDGVVKRSLRVFNEKDVSTENNQKEIKHLKGLRRNTKVER